MSNIRTLASLGRHNPEVTMRQTTRLNTPKPNHPDAASLMGYGAAPETSQDRQESVWEMIKLNCCPHFNLMSFILAVTVNHRQILDVICYTASVAFDYDTFLKPTLRSLDLLGAKDAYKMQKGLQLWRWHTPMLLHVDLLHLAVRSTQFNLIMQLILGFRLEPTIGLWRTFVVYMVSG